MTRLLRTHPNAWTVIAVGSAILLGSLLPPPTVTFVPDLDFLHVC